jgi:hypothetical protein
MSRATSTSSADTPLSNRSTANSRKKAVLFGSLAALVGLLGVGVLGLTWFNSRYQVKDEMQVKLAELSNAEYSANPSSLSKDFQRYAGRELTVIKKDDTHFDFILEPTNEKTARIVIKDVDLSLMVPKVPAWVKGNAALENVALFSREWNRQQVTFPADSEHIEITGGDGFEKESIQEIALTNNCLNAGYWEVSLSVKEGENKNMYYQGWFTFPMGHYKSVFETVNGFSYWPHRWKLEHWKIPQNATVALDSLREVVSEKEASAQFPLNERIIAGGEQARKVRTMLATNLTTWGDFYTNPENVKFATFRAPGYYDAEKAQKNQYWRIGEFKGANLREVKPTGTTQTLQEIELVFGDTRTGDENKLLISGIDIEKLPQLPVSKYSDGVFTPLGIGIPPFGQSYEKLESNPPDENPSFSLLLDSEGQWIEHHSLGVAGISMHLDEKNPDRLHLYLLSYERSTLIAHFLIDL